MIDLNSHFKPKVYPAAPDENIVAGDTYRFTLLTPSLIRLEYSPDGNFEDRATQVVMNRHFDAVNFQHTETADELVITTQTFRLTYNKKPFSRYGLQIHLLFKGAAHGSVWYYGDEPGFNLKGTARTLDEVDGALPLEPGLLSKQGYTVLDDSASMILREDGWVEARQSGIVDTYFFAYGRDYRCCIRDFQHLAGPTPLLPRYALGNWWSRYYRYTEQSYKDLICRFHYESVPLSVAVIDMDWHLVDDVPAEYGHGWTGYTWNNHLFPDPQGFLKWLHDHGLKVTLNVHPADGIRAFEEPYLRMAQAMGIDPATKAPVLFDFSDPVFVKAYFEAVNHPLEEEGVDFWWIDWQQGNATKVPGLDPLWMLNHYHFLDSKRRGRRPMTFSRYAGAGSHRYPVGFSGDTIITWESLDFQPRFTATASNIAYGWWSHDIGGHMRGYRDDELATRWVQLGVFSPINRLHSSNNEFSSKEPWMYSEPASHIMTEYLRLRHRLIPYLYTMNRRSAREGEPLIQPLYYAEPERAEAYEVPNEYYFGTELLCCPITKPIDKEIQSAPFSAWLPAALSAQHPDTGLWFDFFNGRVYSGGRKITLWRGLEAMPVLVRAGAIVPTAITNPLYSKGDIVNSVANPGALEVFVFAGADGTFSLWEDDGSDREDREGAWVETVMELRWKEQCFTVYPAKGNTAVLPTHRRWRFTLCGFADTRLTVRVGSRIMPVERRYLNETYRIVVDIPETAITERIDMVFDTAELADNNVIEETRRFLLRAQIDYDMKTRIMAIVTETHPAAAAIAAIVTMNPSAPLLSALTEILATMEVRKVKAPATQSERKL
jgi:alpha-glucosidase (family GH31 glycosyl hydrolase)